MKKGILCSIAVLALVLGLALSMATPLVVESSAIINLVRSPNPLCYLLNNGATPQAFWWKITYDTTPDKAVLRILDPDGIEVHTETFNLTGLTSPVYNPENTIGDAGVGNAAYAHNWNFSPGIKTGTYRAKLEFYSEIGRESSAETTFQIRQRIQVYKYNDLNGNGINDGEPPLSGWDISVSGPENFSGTTDSTGYAIFPSRNPSYPCALGTEAYRDILASGTYNVTETLKTGWTNTDPGGTAPYQKTFTVPDPTGQTIVVKFGNEELNPEIHLEKYVWDGIVWHDADAPSGPYLPDPDPNPVIFRFVITNTGDVDLTNVTLSDTDMSAFYTNQACTIPAAFPIATMAQGAPAVTVYGKLNWAKGQHSNTATVTGTPPSGPNVADSDPAHYFGSDPDIDVEKDVYDGTTWHDADVPTGPHVPDSIDPVVFRFVITNTGDVDLTNVTLSDTDMSTFYTDQTWGIPFIFPITLAQGAPAVTVYGKLDWAAGQHSNTAYVEGFYGAVNVNDTDWAHYFGANPSPPPPVGWETYPINKLRVLLPWIALLAAIMVGVGLLLLRRRRT